MAQCPTTSLVFTVTRRKAELVAPAKPTPREFKLLSDIDDQPSLHFQVPFIHFYPKKSSTSSTKIGNNSPSMIIGDGGERDPVKIIREALAQTLIFYYPFAGRLREGPAGKLMVDCTGEGVMFIEADADVTLEQFKNQLQPPFPCIEELLYDVPGSGRIVNCPLLLIQVTRLMCDGFILAVRLNHTMCDASGLVQFMTAMSEMAKGACAPSVQPVWQRELLNARSPPRVTCMHHEYDQVTDDQSEAHVLSHNMALRSFYFGPTEVSAIRRFVPSKKCTTFELLTACIWRCRTIALKLDPYDEVRICCAVNGRRKINPPLPLGYYGNVFAFPAGLSTVKNLCQNQLDYAVDLVIKAKSEFKEDYLKSVADLMATKGRPHYPVVGTYIVSDVTRAGFREVDFGWGEAVYGGPSMDGGGVIPGLISFYVPFTNKIKGENGIVVPICLPVPAMEIFAMEIERMMKTEG